MPPKQSFLGRHTCVKVILKYLESTKISNKSLLLLNGAQFYAVNALHEKNLQADLQSL